MKFDNILLARKAYGLFGDNDLDATVPEYWAQEALTVLENSLGCSQLFWRNYESQIQQSGDTVNVQRPQPFTAMRKGLNEDVVVQAARATNIAVKLDQHPYVSFLIRDREMSLSFQNLVQIYLNPAVIALAEMIDKSAAGQVYQFLDNCSGKLGGLTPSNAWTTVLGARKKLNDLKVPSGPRFGILGSSAETTMLSDPNFFAVDKSPDAPEAMRSAVLGRKANVLFLMSQNTPDPTAGAANNDVETAAVNNGAGYPVGATTIAANTFSGAIVDGSWLTIEGDMTPQRIDSITGGSSPTALTISPGLRHAVLDNAVITIYSPGAVNLSGGYEAGYEKTIAFDGFTELPQVGQGLCFDADGTNIYAVVQVTSTTVLLDRPLVTDIANDAPIFLLPAGGYNMVMHPMAVGMVVRPLDLPRDANVRAFVASYNNLSLRVTMSYDAKAQGTLVTVDMLLGFKKLYNEFAVPLLT
jgi:hypothetical protein